MRELWDHADREASRRGCGRQCEQLRADAAGLTLRLGQAKAKEAALARADAARQRLERAKTDAVHGPAEPSMLASLIARRIGGAAEDIARVMALMTAALAIAATVLMASPSHHAMALILDGLVARAGRDAGEHDAEPMTPALTATTPKRPPLPA